MVLVRMAGVAITAVRRAVGLQPGASAVVLGLGLVGNFAAQLLQLAGLEVRGFDVDG
jgi:threonine dehydrogenase-like Zn-dependent dehydrogenase